MSATRFQEGRVSLASSPNTGHDIVFLAFGINTDGTGAHRRAVRHPSREHGRPSQHGTAGTWAMPQHFGDKLG